MHHTFNKHSTTGRTSSLPPGDIKSHGYRSCDVRVICDLIFAAATAAAVSNGEVYGIKGEHEVVWVESTIDIYRAVGLIP